MAKASGFLFFYDLEKTAEFLSDEELGEVLRLVLKRFPEGVEPSTTGGKILYSMLKSQEIRSSDYIEKKTPVNQSNGSKSIGAPRKGETQEEYQQRKALFDRVLEYCKEKGYIDELKGIGPINGLVEEVVQVFNISEVQTQQILQWIRKNYNK